MTDLATTTSFQKVALILTIITTVSGLPLSAQPEIAFSDLPFTPGDTYLLSENSIGESLFEAYGETGGPQLWDFSEEPRDGYRGHQHHRALSVEETGYAETFPEASYAVEVTQESQESAYVFYGRTDAEDGLQIYGNAPGVDSREDSNATVLDPPGLVLRLPLRLGDSWVERRAIDSNDGRAPTLIDRAYSVEAFGEAKLPSGDTVEVLRLSLLTFTKPSPRFGDGYYTLEHFWYAPHLGLVARAFALVAWEPPAILLSPIGVSLSRLTASSRLSSQGKSESVTNLKIQMSDNRIQLTWQAVPGASGYRILAKDRLDSTLWSTLSTIPNPGYSIPLEEHAAQFFQVQSFFTSD